jgi:threonine dehydrogenase-like Zn-dependent dehydrogenase
VVIGQGVLGQLLGQLAGIAGCDPIIGVDLFLERLEFSRMSGFNHGVDAGREDTVEAVMKLTAGEGVALGIDSTSNPETLITLLKIAALAGDIVIVGAPPGTVAISLWRELLYKDLAVYGARHGRIPLQGNHYFPWSQVRNGVLILELIANGRMKVDHLVTHRPAIEDAASTLRDDPSWWGGLDGSGIRLDLIGESGFRICDAITTPRTTETGWPAPSNRMRSWVSTSRA